MGGGEARSGKPDRARDEASPRCTCMKMPAKPLEREKGLHLGSGHRDRGRRENQDGQAVETLWAESPLL